MHFKQLNFFLHHGNLLTFDKQEKHPRYCPQNGHMQNEFRLDSQIRHLSRPENAAIDFVLLF